MVKEKKRKSAPLKDCCNDLKKIRVIRNLVNEYTKVGKYYKATKPISESVTVLCGECFLKVPAGKRLTAILKGLSESLPGE
ncbi:MAG: hypothetical protein ACTSPB_12600 [Candidatus Thorarchaeota archaeon]